MAYPPFLILHFAFLIAPVPIAAVARRGHFPPCRTVVQKFLDR